MAQQDRIQQEVRTNPPPETSLGGGPQIAPLPLRGGPPNPDPHLGVQIAVQNPLVSERLELAVLYKEYAEDDHIYQQKIKVGTSMRLGGFKGHQFGTGSTFKALLWHWEQLWDTSMALGAFKGHW